VTNLVGDVDLVAASSISKQEVFFFLTGFLKKGNLANMETLMISSPEQQLKSKYLKATGVIGFEFLEGTTLPEPINFKKTFTTAIALKQELNIVVTNRLGNASPAVGIMSNRVLPITLSIPN